jgi:uncharacterized NAD(P)/FAD-binding protein YdhS
MSFSFAIIGGGLTGTSMFYQFVDRVREKSERNLLDAASVTIHIFDKQDVFGPGFPHCDRYVMPYHITNMCACDMSIVDGNQTDFQNWVSTNLRVLQEYDDQPNLSISRPDVYRENCRHYPRAVVGEYLKARFTEAVNLARDIQIEVKLHAAVEVTDLKQKADKIHIVARHRQSGDVIAAVADRVLLATGHWFEETDQEHYFTSPWPARNLLYSIPAGESVGVIGSSLSAIETVFTLTSDGKFRRDASGEMRYIRGAHPRKITLYSRSGMLPKVRGRSGAYRNRYLIPENLERCRRENNGHLALEQIFDLLNLDLEAAYGKPFDWEKIINPVGSHADLLKQHLIEAYDGDGPDGELIWQTVLYQTFPMARDIYLSLSLSDKKRFDRKYTTLFFIHAATQPAINAEKILALLNAGVVSVHRLGNDYRFFKDEPENCFVFSYRDNAGRKKKSYHRYVVNARGQEKSFTTNPSELADNLLSSSTVQIEEYQTAGLGVGSGANPIPGVKLDTSSYRTGSIWIDPASHLIMIRNKDGSIVRSHAIYAVGAMTRGQILDASMAYGIARSTAKIAGDLVDSLTSKATIPPRLT